MQVCLGLFLWGHNALVNLLLSKDAKQPLELDAEQQVVLVAEAVAEKRAEKSTSLVEKSVERVVLPKAYVLPKW